tara:strand:+ start:1325 stop:1468 length:144 start_codon:yes stop_codon:yes gene_type:complete
MKKPGSPGFLSSVVSEERMLTPSEGTNLERSGKFVPSLIVMHQTHLI